MPTMRGGLASPCTPNTISCFRALRPALPQTIWHRPSSAWDPQLFKNLILYRLDTPWNRRIDEVQSAWKKPLRALPSTAAKARAGGASWRGRRAAGGSGCRGGGCSACRWAAGAAGLGGAAPGGEQLAQIERPRRAASRAEAPAEIRMRSR